MSLGVKTEFSVFQKQGDQILKGLNKLVSEKNLFKHQADAVKSVAKEVLERQVNGHDNVYQNVSVVILPTGAGKTGVGVLAAYVSRAEKVLVITPSIAISKQQLVQFCYQEDTDINPLQEKPFLVKRGIFKLEDRAHWEPKLALNAIKTADLKTTLAQHCDLVVANAHKYGDGQCRGVNIKIFKKNHYSLIIVDEAHHFPAETWRRIVDHFSKAALILFLTATPRHAMKQILDNKEPCYEYTHTKAVEDGIIRETRFFEVSELSSNDNHRSNRILPVLQSVVKTLQLHDNQDTQNIHKAVILAESILFAKKVMELWNDKHGDFGTCFTYVGDDNPNNVSKFINPDSRARALVVIFRLTEGFDYKNISVAAILRNVGKGARVLFSQFVGRAVRKLCYDDPVEATVISSTYYKQQENFTAFKNRDLAQEDPSDEDENEQ